MTSAALTAFSPCSTTSSCSGSVVAPNNPPVSASVNVRWFHSVGAIRASRVVPATGATMDRRVPVMRLKRVDLPTLGRPTSTTVEVEDLRAILTSVPRGTGNRHDPRSS